MKELSGEDDSEIDAWTERFVEAFVVDFVVDGQQPVSLDSESDGLAGGEITSDERIYICKRLLSVYDLCLRFPIIGVALEHI
jgi:hypothetical protein